jgi:hypothetical protein
MVCLTNQSLKNLSGNMGSKKFKKKLNDLWNPIL